ncbi:2-C-methyl-D-erythritol 4-phosphate cytidylyltransferase [hydrothermal vent metagenome]|uniref:2-C-methyl-D-erythritol 4-phosphate cytidylyltransferase n=1 Tax=hydrothermal vent metagenome TaxID=652676 RepID=A0A3B1BXV9_9ZZZZ
MTMKTVAIIPAGGAGKRFNKNKADTKKQFIELEGIPILARTLIALSKAPQIDEIIVVVPPGGIDYTRIEIVEKYDIPKVSAIAVGGDTRQESMSNGLKHVAKNIDLILVHDGVRPFVTQKMIGDVIKAAGESGAAITAIRPFDTVKTVDGGFVQSTLKRDGIALAQTPQCFRYSILKNAVSKAEAENFTGTDEAVLVELMGVKALLVEGATTNIKITAPEDLKLAEAILALADADQQT